MLTIDNISKSFGAVRVLQNVSLHFAKGTVTGIVGDNGAGKSTLLKIISGIVQPDSGSVAFGSRDVTPLTAAARRELGVEMVYQNLALCPEHDVIENVFMGREYVSAFGLLRRRAMREQVCSLLKELELDLPSLDRKISVLSGGQQQAVAIARAMMFKPAIVLFDEPTAALGAKEVERVIKMIAQQKEAGRTMVLISHRLNDIFAVADRIVVLKHGLVASDDPINGVTLREIVERIVS